MKPATRIIFLALLILIGAYPMGARDSWAFNFTVDSQEDFGDVNPGDTFCKAQNDRCTLRAAIQEANAFPIQHNIALPAGTYILSLGQLTIKENITINGTINEAGQVITFIDGNNISRIFKISDAVPLTLNNLSLQRGAHTADGTESGGGAILNQGTVVANNVTLIDNNGVDAPGNVSYGGGIFNNGDLTLTYCTLSNNRAGNGGGLFNNGTADITDVTFDNNIARSGSKVGGGIYNSGFLNLGKTTINGSVADTGGGLFNDGIMYLTNITLSGNSVTGSGGGIYNGSISTESVVAQATLTNVTISDNWAANGGGIYNKDGNTIALKNTIVANSKGGNCAGVSVNSNGNNLDSQNSCGLFQSTDLINKNPELEALNDNGGPTQTRKLRTSNPASPAINFGAGCPDRDQRGYPRDSVVCDIGAYEVTDKNPYPAISTLFPNSKPEGDPGFTLTVNGYTYGSTEDGSFVAGKSVVLWKGEARPTAFLSKSQLTAAITAADLALAGTAKVTVFNPAEGGGLSNEVTFTITRANLTPTITSLIPDTRPAGGPAFTLTVNGSDFVNQSSVVRWNGIARPTTFVDSSQLTADITSDDLAAMGTASITVSNSPPGGGISNPPVPFTIGPPNLYLPIIIRN